MTRDDASFELADLAPEYNHSTSGVLKNALDYLYNEWNNKAAAFVSYGGVGGARAVEHLRLIASELQLATGRHDARPARGLIEGARAPARVIRRERRRRRRDRRRLIE